MMFKFISIFILSAFFVYISELAQVTHPLCGTSGIAGKDVFAPNPSSCHGYIFCQWNPDNLTHLIAFHQLDCRNQNFNHYEPDLDDPTTGRCVDERVGCEDDVMFFCPDYDIMVANPLDRECRQFRPCRLPDCPWLECRSPLVFNQNLGACDLAENAPCVYNGWRP